MAYFFFVITDVLLLFAYMAMSASDCSPFLSNYIRCDFLITIGALINILFEDKQVVYKEKLIARYILNQNHIIFQSKFNEMKDFYISTMSKEVSYKLA
jgi:hypothetical protein